MTLIGIPARNSTPNFKVLTPRLSSRPNFRSLLERVTIVVSIFETAIFLRSNSTASAKIENRNWKPKWGRREAPTQTHSRQKFPNPKGFFTLRVAQKVWLDL